MACVLNIMTIRISDRLMEFFFLDLFELSGNILLKYGAFWNVDTCFDI